MTSAIRLLKILVVVIIALIVVASVLYLLGH